jgi:GNAT superfamily N-acetyltransferase
MFLIRTATPADAEAIVRLVNSAYRGESSKRGWTTEADILGGQRTDVNGIREMIEPADARIELLLEGDSLLGCVYLKREPGRTCYLGMLTVEPGRQAEGLGKQLLEHSEEVAHQWKCQSMRMTVIHTREELMRFYERRGYRRTEIVSAFPENDPRFGLPKVKGLTFIELVKDL